MELKIDDQILKDIIISESYAYTNYNSSLELATKIISKIKKHSEIRDNLNTEVRKSLDDQDLVISLPCKIGSTVYEVIPPCTTQGLGCPFNGGYGSERCYGGTHCDAYVRPIKFDYHHIPFINKSIFVSSAVAEATAKTRARKRKGHDYA